MFLENPGESAVPWAVQKQNWACGNFSDGLVAWLIESLTLYGIKHCLSHPDQAPV
jgi:hypothetical protein